MASCKISYTSPSMAVRNAAGVYMFTGWNIVKNVMSLGSHTNQGIFKIDKVYDFIKSKGIKIAYYVHTKDTYESITSRYESTKYPQHTVQFRNPNSKNNLILIFTWLGEGDAFIEESNRNSGTYTKFPTINEEYKVKGSKNSSRYYADNYCCGIGVFDLRQKTPFKDQFDEALLSMVDDEDNIGLMIMSPVNEPGLVKEAMSKYDYSWFGNAEHTEGVIYTKLGGVELVYDDDDDDW